MRHTSQRSSLREAMDDTLRASSTARTVAVVIAHALDLEHAVDVLVDQFGFDATFTSLATAGDDDRTLHALWLALHLTDAPA
jgi:hypothetical protein